MNTKENRQLPSQEEQLTLREKETKKPILIIARTNDLFEEYIPRIVSILQSENRIVEVKTFSRENSDDQIRDWVKANRNENFLADKTILTDYTCSGPLDSIKKESSNFEKLISNAIMETVFGEDIFEEIEESGDSCDVHHQAILKTLDFVFSNNPHIKPSKVYLVLNNLEHHVPFIRGSNRLKQQHSNPTVFLTEILNQLTITEIETRGSIFEVPKNVFDPAIVDKSAVMADRHELKKLNTDFYTYTTSRSQELASRGKLFILPFESLYSLLVQTGLVKGSQHTASNLEAIIKRKFGNLS